MNLNGQVKTKWITNERVEQLLLFMDCLFWGQIMSKIIMMRLVLPKLIILKLVILVLFLIAYSICCF